VYITFRGELTLEMLDDGEVEAHEVKQHDVTVLPAGQCHRIRRSPNRHAASLVVKTNLSHRPAVVRCGSCEYFSDPSACPLHRQWQAE
jgi:hypothetical protein